MLPGGGCGRGGGRGWGRVPRPVVVQLGVRQQLQRVAARLAAHVARVLAPRAVPRRRPLVTAPTPHAPRHTLALQPYLLFTVGRHVTVRCPGLFESRRAVDVHG